MISVEGISKVYQISGKKSVPGGSLREALTNGFKNIKDRGKSGPNIKKKEDFWALNDVSFQVEQGDRIGIIGRNGAGKSTLLKILSRITEPTAGKIRLQGRVASLLEVGTGFHPELSGRENIFMNGSILGMSRVEINQRFDEIVDFSGVEKFLDTPSKRYSSGMLVRLAFAVAAHLDPEILIIDEVLAVGDIAFQKKCLGKMREATQSGRTVLFVSHNTGALLNLCNRGVVLHNGKVVCEDLIQPAVEHYNRGFLLDDESRTLNDSPHIIFQKDPASESSGDIEITEVSLLDDNGRAKCEVHIWDNITLRFSYRATKPVKRGALDFRIMTPEGQTLLYLSSEPLGGFPIDLKEGTHTVECRIEKIPLSAGSYRLEAGIAIPNVEWLVPLTGLGELTVLETDVYQSGHVPGSDRTAIALPHQWRAI